MSTSNSLKNPFKKTLFLPQTTFPMQAKLAQKEIAILSFWEKVQPYYQAVNPSLPYFILHDGPPYANGHIHMGTALNKILKDIINRYQKLQGKNVLYIPGWDCHGLPIEWSVEQNLCNSSNNLLNYNNTNKKENLLETKQYTNSKSKISSFLVRKNCRAFATKWLTIQKQEFQRLGVAADWNHPYLTMDKKAEAQIIAEIHKFLMNGSLYLGNKTVMWSIAEKTSLAEAEIEYHEINSTSIYLAFPIIKGPQYILDKETKLIIWTTTPWTIPGNRAIAFNPKIEYGLYKDTKGNYLILANKCVLKLPFSVEYIQAISLKENAIEISCRHPLQNHSKHVKQQDHKDCPQGYNKVDQALNSTNVEENKNQKYEYNFDIPLIPADFVNTDCGTGLVHIAPSHGEDDFALAKKHGIFMPDTVDEGGYYYDNISLVGGQHIFNYQPKLIETLENTGLLLGKTTIKHAYPHSWRSRQKLIYRNTKQWFISMDKFGIRQKALEQLKQIDFYPKQSINRLQSMIKNRPDWLISRQRNWGVPIAIFIHRETQIPIKDHLVNKKIYETICSKGIEAWFELDNSYYLGDNYIANDYIKVTDIVDVWFESGSTHAFVLQHFLPYLLHEWNHTQGSSNIETSNYLQLVKSSAEDNPKNHHDNISNLPIIADLCLEGSDQHRGWFQASLLEASGTTGIAPYKALLTHGFVLDQHGYKMSKSLGNVILPSEIINQYGADILRLWSISGNFTEDIKVSPDIMNAQVDVYRRIRNTFRFLLSNIHSWDRNLMPYQELTNTDKWILHKLSSLYTRTIDNSNNYNLHNIYAELYNFCNTTLSALYFDIKKFCLYCISDTDPIKRSCLTTFKYLLDYLCQLYSPILAFTTEEVWMHYNNYLTEDNQNSCTAHNQSHLYNNNKNFDLVQSWGKLLPSYSIHLTKFSNPPADWNQPALDTAFSRILIIRDVANLAIDKFINQNLAKTKLELKLIFYLSLEDKPIMNKFDLNEIFMVSQLEINYNLDNIPADAVSTTYASQVYVRIELAQGHKCARCLRILSIAVTIDDKVNADGICAQCQSWISGSKFLN